MLHEGANLLPNDIKIGKFFPIIKDMCFEWNFSEFISFAEFHSKK